MVRQGEEMAKKFHDAARTLFTGVGEAMVREALEGVGQNIDGKKALVVMIKKANPKVIQALAAGFGEMAELDNFIPNKFVRTAVRMVLAGFEGFVDGVGDADAFKKKVEGMDVEVERSKILSKIDELSPLFEGGKQLPADKKINEHLSADDWAILLWLLNEIEAEDGKRWNLAETAYAKDAWPLAALDAVIVTARTNPAGAKRMLEILTNMVSDQTWQQAAVFGFTRASKTVAKRIEDLASGEHPIPDWIKAAAYTIVAVTGASAGLILFGGVFAGSLVCAVLGEIGLLAILLAVLVAGRLVAGFINALAGALRINLNTAGAVQKVAVDLIIFTAFLGTLITWTAVLGIGFAGRLMCLVATFLLAAVSIWAETKVELIRAVEIGNMVRNVVFTIVAVGTIAYTVVADGVFKKTSVAPSAVPAEQTAAFLRSEVADGHDWAVTPDGARHNLWTTFPAEASGQTKKTSDGRFYSSVCFAVTVPGYTAQCRAVDGKNFYQVVPSGS